MIQQSFKNDQATLFLVATPIGNLNEMTPRAVEILKTVDLIAAEDTRNSAFLLKHFDIKTPMIAYHDFNEDTASIDIVKHLEAGKNIALISDAGYPLISDPGHTVSHEVIKAGYNVVPISGSSAFLAALVASGLIVHPFAFLGFLEAKEQGIINQLNEVKDLKMTLVYYLSVHKVEKTLKIMYDVLGDRQVCLAREITKKHEEFIRGPLLDVMNSIDVQKGEYVIVIEKSEDETTSQDDLLAKIDSLIEDGMKPSKAISHTAKESKVSKNELYNAYHQKKEKE
ncbi:16S rRNA (cytidine(1402)-2'-O)-methyltransferase [Erysipelothrix urinaevulpis]|uniref:16S rRNA (cytidine(1402)-2'-O)-methyltransferase n=1 Tax=Erysipelothrix urinaevulpis TaxID=2683717 RepID=UPI00135C0777|nr:16S rRNA (cytidine(1402)-2'-O)-methyltransferase [Erysipelothrix urinaevulpis]